jgi:uncharacterized protein (DUF1800 family)
LHRCDGSRDGGTSGPTDGEPGGSVLRRMPERSRSAPLGDVAMAVTWNAENAAHLLRRATFGPRPSEVDAAVDKGMNKTISGLFKKPESDKYPGGYGNVYLDQIQAWWLRRMAATEAPLVEKLTLLWHNHFATGYSKVESAKFMHAQNRVLRKHALGSFRDMVHAVSKGAAMLIWLDGDANTDDNLNENFARELMELFTTGVLDQFGNPNYTEQDVVEAARAFTGWDWDWPSGKFQFEPWNHDFGAKTSKGQTANFTGEEIIDLLVVDPATARRVAWRLFNQFAYPVDLDDPVLDPLAQLYLDHDTAIRPMVEALFRMDEFYSPQAKHALVKDPVDWYVGSLRMLKGKFSDKKSWFIYDFSGTIQHLGQSIFDPPSVFGWKDGLAWASSNGLFARAQHAADISESRKHVKPPIVWDPIKLLPPKDQWPAMTATALVERLVALLGSAPFEASTIAHLVSYVETGPNGSPVTFVLDAEAVDVKVRGLVGLILACPEFQLH